MKLCQVVLVRGIRRFENEREQFDRQTTCRWAELNRKGWDKLYAYLVLMSELIETKN